MAPVGLRGLSFGPRHGGGRGARLRGAHRRSAGWPGGGVGRGPAPAHQRLVVRRPGLTPARGLEGVVQDCRETIRGSQQRLSWTWARPCLALGHGVSRVVSNWSSFTSGRTLAAWILLVSRPKLNRGLTRLPKTPTYAAGSGTSPSMISL